MKPRSSLERWRTHWGREKQLSPLPIGTHRSFSIRRRGILVPFHDANAIAEQTIWLLENEAERHAMRKRAYLYSRNMVWKSVAQDYMRSFQKARAERLWNPRLVSPNPVNVIRSLPPLRVDHLSRMTDDTGIFQHAVFAVPNQHEGYTTDDNARALITAIMMEQSGTDSDSRGEEIGLAIFGFSLACVQLGKWPIPQFSEL